MIEPNLRRQIATVFSLLDTGTRRKLVYVFLAMVVLGVLESFSVGLFLPLFQVIVDPSALDRYARMLGLAGDETFTHGRIGLPALIAVIVVAFVLKNAMQLAVIHGMNKFIYRKQAQFLSQLFAAYLARDYAFHLRRNMSISLRNLTVSAVAVFSNGLMPILNLAMEAIMVVGVGIVLILVDPVATLVMGGTLGLCGVLVHRTLAPRAGRWGADLNTIAAVMLQWISESLGSIKAVKVAGREQFFTGYFTQIVNRKSHNETNLATMIHLPRLTMESIVIVLLGGVVIMVSRNGANLLDSLPLLGLYAIAAMRLMPSINRILNQSAQIRIGASAIAGVEADMMDMMRAQAQRPTPQQAPVLRQSVELRDVSFVHEDSLVPALDKVSLRIEKGETIALVGPSGAGKSTLVDLLIGLIQPTSGEIAIDGVKIETLPVGWNGRVGYVPQHIFLVDDTLRKNIAFGIPTASVQEQNLAAAIDLANLQPVIDGLAQGVDAFIGENGGRLSGGQRQRIGIARAIFAQPDLLILDEATSALDLETERSIVDAIDQLRGRVTTIIIAHHLSTVRNCDRLVLLDQGRVTGVGTYGDLLQSNDSFRRLVELSQLEQPAAAR